MILRITLFFLVIVFSCESSKNTSDNTVDGDNAEEAKQELVEDPLSQQQEQARRKVIESYEKVIEMDSTINPGNDTVKIEFKYYCTFDSLLLIPGEYYSDGQPFLTHNFVSDIKIFKNGDIIYDDIVNKEHFENILTDELLKHAGLRYPYFKGFDDNTNEISFHYSVSIPATDIGTGLNLFIDLEGNSRVSDR